jgi:hypothetical protein
VNPQTNSCRAFGDPIPPRSRVTGVRAKIQATRMVGIDIGMPEISASLNGIDVGGFIPLNVTSNECSTTVTANSPDYPAPAGFPGYIYGGANIASWTLRNGVAMVGAVTIEITYVAAESVFFDVDGVYDRFSPVDDLPMLIPGAGISGASLAPSEVLAGQLVRVHVQTGVGVRGNITTELPIVSHKPGIAMNYPVPGDTSPDVVVLDPVVKVNAKTNDTVVRILIKDYAALATLKITIPTGTKSTYSTFKAIPRDTNSNGLADAWHPTYWTTETGLKRGEDIDNEPIASGSFNPAGILGDGLSNYQEYRGFVVAGFHVRTDPRKKDLFVLEDNRPELRDYLWVLRRAPLNIHELWSPDEVKMESDGLRPLVVPNNDTSDTLTQHAVRLRYRDIAPRIHRFDGSNYSNAAGFYHGYCFAVGEDPDLIDETSASSVRTPNETLVVEYYPGSFYQRAILPGPDGSIETTVVECAPGAIEMCDIGILEAGVLKRIDPGEDQVLDSLSAPSDRRTEKILDACDGAPIFWEENDPDPEHEIGGLRALVIAHEVGHGVNLFGPAVHSGACGDLMYVLVNVLTSASPERFTHEWSGADAAYIRLHE